MRIDSYRDLTVWQKSVELVLEVYRITKTFPSAELYGLTSQMRRAAVSIPANIAEGRTRSSRKDYRHFLFIAFGSGAGLETHIVIAKRLKYCEEQAFAPAEALLDEVMKMLNALISKLS